MTTCFTDQNKVRHPGGTHDDLVATAQRLLPGVVVHEDTAPAHRARLFAEFREQWGHLSPAERLAEGLRACCLGASLEPPPYGAWCADLAEEIRNVLEGL